MARPLLGQSRNLHSAATGPNSPLPPSTAPKLFSAERAPHPKPSDRWQPHLPATTPSFLVTPTLGVGPGLQAASGLTRWWPGVVAMSD